MNLNKNNGATWAGLIGAVVIWIETIEWSSFDFGRDWLKLLLGIGVAVAGYFVSFNGASLNKKARN